MSAGNLHSADPLDATAASFWVQTYADHVVKLYKQFVVAHQTEQASSQDAAALSTLAVAKTQEPGL